MANEKCVVVGTIVSPNSLDSLSIWEGFLAVENGKIHKKGTSKEFLAFKETSEFAGYEVIQLGDDQFLMPGFVDCHTHAPQFPNIGLGLDRPLLEWLNKYTFPLEKRYSDVKFAASVYDIVVKKLLRNGTTTACYFGSLHMYGTLELVKSVIKHGQRALVGKVSMNIENNVGYYNDTEKELLDTEEFIKSVIEYQNELVSPIVTPRFAVSCNDELMTGLAKIARKYNCMTQSHISENHNEVELVLKMNPGSDSYGQVYNKCGVLNSKCIMAHAVHLTEEEMKLLAAKGVSVAHCPASNTRLRSGLCPVRRLLDHNITVGLGTDVAGGDSATILDAIRRSMDVSTYLEMQDSRASAVGWRQALCIATLGGAKALNLDDKIGNFDVGKDFDALLVDVYAKGGPIDCYKPAENETREQRLTELVQRFVYLGDDRNIAKVYVKGRQVQ